MKSYPTPVLLPIVTLILLTCSLVPKSPAAELSGSRPNIILVMTDDQGYGDLSCHGHPFLNTYNLDKLHKQSTRFTDFHASPTCAPTRAALMTGRAPFKNGITHTILERERMTLSTTTIAEVLRDSGYTTGIFGKWHLGDDDPYQPENRGFDEVFIHGAGGIGQNYPGTQGAVPGTGYFNPIIKHNGVFEQTSGFCTDVFFRQALGWIKEASSSTKPFFAYIPTNAPHGPFIAPEEYKVLYRDYTGGDEQHAAFFGMIHNIDDNMGLLMRKLAEWDLEDNTLLIFMTDNGTARGGKYFNAGMKGNKGSVNEGGSRVPLFMNWKGKIKPGTDLEWMTRHYDLFPTLAELAGAILPEGQEIDGRSLLPLLQYPKDSWKDPWMDRFTFFHLGRWSKEGADGRWGEGNTDPDKAKYKSFAVRSERWRLVGKGTLYDIIKDPGEKNNVISQHPEVARTMLEAYDEWWDEVRPLMINENAPLDTGKPLIEQFKRQNSTTGIPDWVPPDL
ncbi:MAG: arylsulfatase [Puniceicoccaceae bacterium]